MPTDEIEFIAHIDSTCHLCNTKGYDFICMPLERHRRIIFKCRKCKETFSHLEVTVNCDGSGVPCGATCVVMAEIGVPTSIHMRPAYRSKGGNDRFVMFQSDKIKLNFVSW